MQNRVINEWTFIVVISLSIGVLCYSLFPLEYMLVATVIAIMFTAIGALYDLIAKTTYGLRLTGYIFFFFLIITLTSFIEERVIESRMTKFENKLINALYLYKNKSGHFPENVDFIQIDGPIKLLYKAKKNYWTDASMHQFELISLTDGLRIFRSSDSTWEVCN